MKESDSMLIVQHIHTHMHTHMHTHTLLLCPFLEHVLFNQSKISTCFPQTPRDTQIAMPPELQRIQNRATQHSVLLSTATIL